MCDAGLHFTFCIRVQNQKSTLEEEEKEAREDDEKETKDGENESRTTSMANREVLRRLRQLETQLTAIETRARTVEGELLISNQVRLHYICYSFIGDDMVLTVFTNALCAVVDMQYVAQYHIIITAHRNY